MPRALSRAADPYPHPKTLAPYVLGVLGNDQDSQPCEPLLLNPLLDLMLLPLLRPLLFSWIRCRNW